MIHSAFRNRKIFFEAIADDGSKKYLGLHFDGKEFVCKPGDTPEDVDYRVEEIFA